VACASLPGVANIAVLGPGGVGGFIAAALSRAGQDVVVVAREPTAERIRREGIAVSSVVLGDFTVRPAAVARLEEPADVLIVATKATALDAALTRIDAQPGLVVPLLNGIEHLGTLRGRFGAERVAAAVIRIDSDRPEPGRIVQKSPSARVDLAGGEDPRLQALSHSLEDAGVEVRTGGTEAEVLWSKLMRLNALALTTSAADETIGYIRSDPRWRSALEGCVRETAAVARAEGAVLDPAATLQELEQAHADLGSSMRRDLAAGREPELDAIAGAVIRAGARHGLRCPTTRWLRDRVAGRVRAGV
jgi:2-dehydropantoate 2-reductase